MLTAAAEYEYNHDHFRKCYQLSGRVLAKDPFQQHVLPASRCPPCACLTLPTHRRARPRQ